MGLHGKQQQAEQVNQEQQKEYSFSLGMYLKRAHILENRNQPKGVVSQTMPPAKLPSHDQPAKISIQANLKVFPSLSQYKI